MEVDTVTEPAQVARPKDATELALEDILFGTGIRDQLSFGKADAGQEMTAVADDDLFFIDENPNEAPAVAGDDEAEGDGEGGQSSSVMPAGYAPLGASQPAAWEDSDDERLTVSLANNPRLRKLRVREGEDVVSGTEYVRRLRWQFERLHPRPEWAKFQPEPDSAGDDDDDEEEGSGAEEVQVQPSKALAQLLRSNTLVHESRRLKPEVIDIQRLPGLFQDTNPGAITQLRFHPKLPIVMSAGPSGTVYLHHFNGALQTPNPHPLLVSMHLQKVGITSASFVPPEAEAEDEGRVLLAGRRRYFHVWNMAKSDITRVTRIQGHEHEQRSFEQTVPSPCGRHIAVRGSAKKGASGVVNILDSRSMQWQSQVRIDSVHGVRDFAWWADGTGLSVLGADGTVTEWNVQTEECVGVWEDESIGASVIRLSGAKKGRGGPLGGDRWVAVGNRAGIVNIYDRQPWAEAAVDGTGSAAASPIPARPAPVRAVENLTSPITHLAFSPPGRTQVLAVASHSKRDALRLVHLPTGTVYRNWPAASTPLGRVSAVEFGLVRMDGAVEGGGRGESGLVLAVANDAGRVTVWEIR